MLFVKERVKIKVEHDRVPTEFWFSFFFWEEEGKQWRFFVVTYVSKKYIYKNKWCRLSGGYYSYSFLYTLEAYWLESKNVPVKWKMGWSTCRMRSWNEVTVLRYRYFILFWQKNYCEELSISLQSFLSEYNFLWIQIEALTTSLFYHLDRISKSEVSLIWHYLWIFNRKPKHVQVQE